MSSSVRFIGYAVFAWAGVRAISLGLVPGTGMLAIDRPADAADRSSAAVPALEPTQFAPIEPLGGTPGTTSASEPPVPVPTAAGPVRMVPSYAPIYLPLPAYSSVQPGGQSRARLRIASNDTLLPEPRKLPFSSEPVAPADHVVLASAPAPDWTGRSTATPDAVAPPLTQHSKRLQLSAWALLRGKPGDLLGPNSLAANGATLGGSQAGARISYWITPHIAASLRSSTPLGGARGGEVALGVRYQPFLSVPVSFTAERRQRFGRAGGRNDFALFAEGGVWDRRMPAGFRLNGYAQAGVVGIKSHDLFVDGAFTLTRPIWKKISAGFGVWGGAQPHLYRLDAGPRLTIAMTKSMRVHVDYRRRLLGVAYPSSGPAVTIAGDF